MDTEQIPLAGAAWPPIWHSDGMWRPGSEISGIRRAGAVRSSCGALAGRGATHSPGATGPPSCPGLTTTSGVAWRALTRPPSAPPPDPLHSSFSPLDGYLYLAPRTWPHANNQVFSCVFSAFICVHLRLPPCRRNVAIRALTNAFAPSSPPPPATWPHTEGIGTSSTRGMSFASARPSDTGK